MVDLENHLDMELGSFLNGEWLVLELLDSLGRRQLDLHIVAALDPQGKGLNETLGVAGLSNGVASVQTQGGFPADHGLIILVCWEYSVSGGRWVGLGLFGVVMG